MSLIEFPVQCVASEEHQQLYRGITRIVSELGTQSKYSDNFVTITMSGNQENVYVRLVDGAENGKGTLVFAPRSWGGTVGCFRPGQWQQHIQTLISKANVVFAERIAAKKEHQRLLFEPIDDVALFTSNEQAKEAA